MNSQCHFKKIILGFLTGQIQFPSWLGKNSKKSKVNRTLQKLHVHTRLCAGVSKSSFALDYGLMLRDHIISPMVKQGAGGVDQAVSNMEAYCLLREDLAGLIEVTQWPDNPDPLKAVDIKIRAAFTRKYNKNGKALPYNIAMAISHNTGVGAGEGEEMMSCEEVMDEEDKDGDTVEKDASIKLKKKLKAAVKSGSGSSKEEGKRVVAIGNRKK